MSAKNNKWIVIFQMLPFLILFFFFLLPVSADGSDTETLILNSSTKKIDLYPFLYMLEDNKKELTIEDVSSEQYAKGFIHSHLTKQAKGFFETATWLRIDIHNESDRDEWLLEFGFPLIYYINIYVEDEDGIVELEEAGADFPFHQRKIEHRNFLFNLDIDPNATKTFYMVAHGGGDLHPPIKIWEANSFIEKTQLEFSLLGLLYGMISVMILYNLFIYFSVRFKSYLYYVLAITCTMIGQLSINGFSFQYLWPNYPNWNLISAPFWVSLACIFILLFTKNFLDTDRYVPKFKFVLYGLIILNGLVIFTLPISHYIGLNSMLVSTTFTFTAVLTTAFISLKRGARQARFFIIGWIVFLVGVFITILERVAVLPYTIVTEYAGQVTLTVEVVLLSLALADKISIMRIDKAKAEQEAKRNQQLAINHLKEADESKDEFLAITSHELRTPLYGMIGIAESLRDGVVGRIPAKMNDQLSIIINSGKRLTTLVNDILDFSKLKHDSISINLRPVHLRPVVDIIFITFQPLVKNKPIKLINNLEDSLPAVIADQNRLKQILYNLIDNAIKHTDAGEVVISAKLIDAGTKITVSDTGRGISEEEQQKIFEPFKQIASPLSRDTTGTGIGLSITKRLVDLHDGTIEVESIVGKGTNFSFILPKQPIGEIIEEIALTVEPLMEVNFELSTPEVSHTTVGAKILVADDEQVNLQVLVSAYIRGV